MKRLYTLLFLATYGVANILAQSPTGFNGNGYYRICNFETERYIYVTDNKDYYDQSRDAGDFQAIQLWKDINRTISSPASVIYIEEVSNNQYDLMAQGTGVHALTGFYVSVIKKSTGIYEVCASVSKAGIQVTKYLTDDEQSSEDQGTMGTNGVDFYRFWVVDRITTNHATNYFGIKPTLELNGMYYQPFFASFPFKAASPDMCFYYIEKIEGNNAIMKKIEGEVPANTPVIIECTSADPSQNRIELLISSTAQVSGNKLSGVYFCNGKRPQQSKDAYTKFDASTMRVFSVVDGRLVLTNDAPESLTVLKGVRNYTTGKKEDIPSIPANVSYLKTDASTPVELDVCLNGMGINDIFKGSSKGVEGVYNISGTQLRSNNDIEGLPAGLYIVGGKKVVISK